MEFLIFCAKAIVASLVAMVCIIIIRSAFETKLNKGKKDHD